MKAVILAAGKSTRTYPLTVNVPKPMLKILDKTILEHNLVELESTKLIKEVIIVVGFKKQMIIDHIGNKYGSLKITYVEQKELNGTGGALLACKDKLDDSFLILNGDDLYSHKDINKCLMHKYCVMAKEVENPEIWGIFTLKDGIVQSFIEKPKDSKSNFGNIGLYVFDKKVFDCELKKTKRDEFEFTDYINFLVEKGETVHCETLEDYWVPVGYPWHYLEANVFFLNKIKGQTIKGEIEEGAIIKGDIIVEKGTIVKSGTYIEGPVYIGKNCEIGPNAYIRKDTIIMDGVRTRAEIVDSVLMDNVTAKHHCYIGHSVIGSGCNIAGGTMTTDYRHDGKNNITLIKGKKVDTKRRKLGAFLGEKVFTGAGTVIYPGRKIWPGKTTRPGEIVDKDIE